MGQRCNQRQARYLFRMPQRRGQCHRAAERMPDYQWFAQFQGVDQGSHDVGLHVQAGRRTTVAGRVAATGAINSHHSVGFGQLAEHLITEVARDTSQAVNHQDCRAFPGFDDMQSGSANFDEMSFGWHAGLDPFGSEKSEQPESCQYQQRDD